MDIFTMMLIHMIFTWRWKDVGVGLALHQQHHLVASPTNLLSLKIFCSLVCNQHIKSCSTLRISSGARMSKQSWTSPVLCDLYYRPLRHHIDIYSYTLSFSQFLLPCLKKLTFFLPCRCHNSLALWR